jgi:RND family efflux transporter MFP subunit
MSSSLAKRIEPDMNPLNIQRLTEEAEREPQEPTPAPHAARGRLVAITAIAGLVLAGGGWYAYTKYAAHQGSAGVAETAGKGEQPAGKATLGFVSGGAATNGKNQKIVVVPVEVTQRSDILRLTGSLAADERSSVASNVSGIVAEVLVDRGSVVRKNDVLVQLDPTDAKNKLSEGRAMLQELKARLGLDGNVENFNPEDQPEVRLAKASADLAVSNLKRAKEMFSKKVISTEAYDQTKTECELATQRYRQALLLIKQAYSACQTAMTKLAILEKAVADTTIRAPFDGWVAEKLVAVGEQINSGPQATKVLTLVRVDPLRLSLTVPQQDIGRICPGQVVRFRVDSFPDRTFDGKVQFIAPVVTNDTRSMVVEAIVKNPDGALRPGLFATAELELKGQAQAVYAPTGAVQKTGEVGRVFVVRDGVAREQVVALGEEIRGRIEIRAGLKGQERLVASPDLVHDGDLVRP